MVRLSINFDLIFLFNWSTVGLQCWIMSCYTAKWFSYIYIYILFQILLHYSLLLFSHWHVWLSVTPRTAAHQASLSSTIFWSLLKLMSIEPVMPSNHLILCRPLLLLPSAAAKLLQSCPTLCDPIDSSQLGSPVPGILQARTLKWVAISFSPSCPQSCPNQGLFQWVCSSHQVAKRLELQHQSFQ